LLLLSYTEPKKLENTAVIGVGLIILKVTVIDWFPIDPLILKLETLIWIFFARFIFW